VRKPISQSINALITNKNKPKVKRVSGKVKSTKIGLTIALTNPKITAAITQVSKKYSIGFLELITNNYNNPT
jgi:hypothetical protein